MPRPRLATELKLLKGTFRPSRERQRASGPPLGIPKPSRALSDAVRAEYDRLVALLEPRGVLTEGDGLVLELGAHALADFWRLDGILLAEGQTYSSAGTKGAVMTRPRPEVAARTDAWRRAVAVLEAVGLTPTARSKVYAARVPELEDPIEAFRRARPRPGGS
jgi:P27 family predicted phage terminase small subunit